MANRKDDTVSLDDLNPLDLEGTAEDIALIERGLAIMARKQIVWAAVLEGWKKHAGMRTGNHVTASPSPLSQKSEVDAGTMASLAHRYCTDERSPYRKLRYKTRLNYDNMIRRIVKDCGDAKLADLKSENIRTLYEEWSERGKSIAHSLVTMMRGLINFGVVILKDEQCERLSVVLHNMRFKVERARTEELTTVQANAIRVMAHKMGRPSLALAQALQFECGLTQKDVIGEWVPITEQGESNVTDDGKKWLHGLRWEEINNLTLRRGGSEFNLAHKPMVREELNKLGELPPAGPVIVCEFSDLPWTAYEFRRWWRKVADACRIPKNVRNMDSRMGSNRRKRINPSKAGNGVEPSYEDADIEHELAQGSLYETTH